jgi:tetratricopeptide (TPR) repeat protein
VQSNPEGRGIVPEQEPRGRLRKARELREWSRPELVAQLQRHEDRLGTGEELRLDTKLIEKWENGRVHPRPFYAARLCLLFQATPEQLDLGPSARLDREISRLGRPGSWIVSTGHPESSAVSGPRYWKVPHQRNPFFAARDEVLDLLQDLMGADRKVVAVTQQAICGLGGIGKTQVALEYAFRFAHQYQGVFWVTAESEETIRADLLSMGRMLPPTASVVPTEDEALAGVRNWLNENDRWLLVLDNADDPELVRDLLASTRNGHVLMTTRAQAVGEFAHRVELRELSPRAGALLLLRRSGMLSPLTGPLTAHEDFRLATTLVHELGGLPLAIDQAGAYLEETSSSVEDYLRIYRQHRRSLLSRRGGLLPGHPASVATTLSLSIQRLQEMDQVAADVLRVCAFLDPDAIPEEIVTEGASSICPSLRRLSDDGMLHLHQAIASLRRFSLVSRNPATRTLTVHRLVQACLQDAMDDVTRNRWEALSAQSVRAVLPKASTEYSASGQPHRAVQVLRASLHTSQGGENIPSVLWRLAVQQQVLGRLMESDQTLQECLSICKGGTWRNDQVKAHQYLALLRAYQGRRDESAEQLDLAQAAIADANVRLLGSGLQSYRALCDLLAGDLSTAGASVNQALALARQTGDVRDTIRASWLKGRVLTILAEEEDEHGSLTDAAGAAIEAALRECRQHEVVDYEADLLLARGHLHLVKGELPESLLSTKEAHSIARRSGFRLLEADIHCLFALLSLAGGQQDGAAFHARQALSCAYCDGPPYSYVPAIRRAERYLGGNEHVRAGSLQ